MIEAHEVLPLILNSIALVAGLVALGFNLRARYYLRKSAEALCRADEALNRISKDLA